MSEFAHSKEHSSSSKTHRRSISTASASGNQPSENIESPVVGNFREEQRLMDFYGLEELVPETWNDANANPISPNSGDISMQATQVAPSHNYFEDEDVDPLGIKESILGAGQGRHGGIKARKLRTQILLTSRDFDPKKFLVETHRNTNYADLLVGYKNLQDAVDKRQETLKTLVKSNFDRFVGAKATVEAVYRELKVKNLGSAGYGTEDFYLVLESASNEANSLFGPIMERRNNADKIKATMNVLDRYKFFFNLPSTLEESVKKEKYEQAVREYRKGKSIFMMTKEPEGNERSSSPVRKNIGLIKVFEKVWEEVERTISTLRVKLFGLLENMELSLDVHERLIGYLMDLDSVEDPVWHFINAHHTWIKKMLYQAFDQYLHAIEASVTKYVDSNNDSSVRNYKALEDISPDNLIIIYRQNAIRLLKHRRALLSANFKEFETIFGKDVETKVWKAILNLYSQFSDILSSYIPDFWNVCRHFIDGKFFRASHRRNKSSVDQEQAEKCLNMFGDILETYSKHLNHVVSFILTPDYENYVPSFHLPNTSGEVPQSGQTDLLKAFYSNLRANRVHIAYYLPKLVIQVSECLNSITKSLKPITNDVLSTDQVLDLESLQKFLESLKDGFASFVCRAWITEASIVYCQETGKNRSDTLSLEKNDGRGSVVIKLMSRLQKLCMRSLFQIVTMIEWPTSNREELELPKKLVVSTDTLANIKKSFSESIYAFFDGLHYLAIHPTAWEEWVSIHSGKSQSPISESADSKLLIILENIDVSKKTFIPLWQKMFMDLFKSQLGPHEKELSNVASHLDGIVFDMYIKRKRKSLQEIVTHGSLYSGFDWKRESPPVDLHPFVNESLFYLVKVHAEIKGWLSSEADDQPNGHESDQKQMNLTQRVFVTLLLTLVHAFHDAYRSIDGMSPFGGMHAMMDISAVMDIVGTYSDFIPNSTSLERSINSIIIENITEYLQTTKSSEIKDVSEWLDSQKDSIESVVELWKRAGEIGHRCLRN